jgi:hypothetical protein
MLQSLSAMDSIFTKVIKDNQNNILNVAPYTLTTTDLNKRTAQKGCRSFIDAWSQGVDSGCDFKISSNGRSITTKADAKKGYKLDDNVKGINSSGGFEVPERTKVELNFNEYYWGSITFDSSAKKDLNTFTVSSHSSLKMTYAAVKGGAHAYMIPDNVKDTYVYLNMNYAEGTTGSAYYVGSGTDNTTVGLSGYYNYDCAAGAEIKNNNIKILTNSVDRIDPPSDEPNWYT